MRQWTPIWLDTETDGFHGRLLSIALVTQSGPSFYGALPPIHVTDSWAIRHVLPVLGAPTHMDDIALATDMAAWLGQFDGAEIIADWQRDLGHFFMLLGPHPGRQLRTCPLRASLKPWLNGVDGDERHGPLHNAMGDARRMMYADLATNSDTRT